VERQPEASPRLPFVHTTDAYRLVNTLEDGELIPRPCTVFSREPLIYLFYGRPSYRVNASEPPTTLEHYLPVCLLLRSDRPYPIKRVFPFDSGGFDRSLYVDALHRDMQLPDFSLLPDPATPGRLVSLFFDSAADYLRSHPKTNLSFDPAEPEAQSYYALISQRLSNSVDNRVSAIEIQVEGKLTLAGNVEAIVLPSPLLDSPTISHQLKALGVAPLPYLQIDRQRPSEYVTTIFDTCYEYYRRVGLSA
jgi:hypothetical protein